jgi:hypothetical protein
MKIKLMMKDPDYEILVDNILDTDILDNDDVQNARDYLGKYLKWDEYLTVEFDTETHTYRICP